MKCENCGNGDILNIRWVQNDFDKYHCECRVCHNVWNQKGFFDKDKTDFDYLYGDDKK